MNTIRNYGIDALRILSMMMVVTLHILTNGEALNSTKVFSGQYEMAWLLQIACFGAVNCYVIISGKVRAGNYLISYISPTILLGSIFLVTFVQNIQIKGVI